MDIKAHLLAKLGTVTTYSGVYQMLDSTGEIIYIGKAKNLKARLKSYFLGGAKDTKTTKLVNNIVDFKTIVVRSNTEALLLENELIKKYQPKYNILLKDAKSYPYIIITKDTHPRIGVYRGKQSEQYHFFGPYTSPQFVRSAVATLRKVFKLRECKNSFYSNRSRPCLDYQVGICLAPCTENTLENEAEYTHSVSQVMKFLRGQSNAIITRFQEQMLEASEALDFERAASYRDQIIQLRKISDHEETDVNIDVVYVVQQANTYLIQLLFVRDGRQIDSEYVIPKHTGETHVKDILTSFIPQYYLGKKIPKTLVIPQDIRQRSLLAKSLGCNILKNSDTEKQKFIDIAQLTASENLKQHIYHNKRLHNQLQRVQEVFGLETPPQTIECFDISHHSGEDIVASCVRFVGGKPHKAAYKKFNIRTVDVGDDYGAMREVINRRYKHKENLPDLLLIDGGLGQLNSALSILEGLQLVLHVVGVAKGEGRKAGLETLITKVDNAVGKINLMPDDSALNLINYVRDEAHRFAITTHRKKSMKRKTEFSLEQIPGVGRAKSKELLTYFGSIGEIKEAPINRLVKVNGINDKIATEIYTFFHGSAPSSS